MYNQPYFIPNFYQPTSPFILRRIPTNNFLRATIPTKGLNIFTRLGNRLNTLKTINWSNIINNTSKTLGIINQTIPIVKQVGPVMNNMKEMVKVASIFKDETDNKHQSSKKSNYSTTQSNSKTKQPTTIKEDYSPTFFIDS